MAPQTEKLVITVTSTVNASLQRVWDMFTGPIHILHWNNASDDWQTSYAENDLRPGGAFLSRMEARDGSEGFDFSGRYTEVIPGKSIAYTLDDGRDVNILFRETGGKTLVMESFVTEDQNSAELQRTGWQAILDNFRKYVEGYGQKEMMNFEITIDNTPENIFRIMLDTAAYGEWTKVFNPTSRFEGSWEKGEKILFLGTDADGKTGGMVCRIRENIPGKFISIESLREIVDGKEVTGDEKASPWHGALENYSLKPVGDKTLLSIDTDVPTEMKSYFIDAWPKALEKLKSLCE
ncbi:MAG: SRPBCC family protein [Bacteroidales bacterium]